MRESAVKMIKCVSCTRFTPNSENYCVHCGVLILPSDELFCSDCNELIKKDDTRCFVCGKNLTEEHSIEFNFDSFFSAEKDLFIDKLKYLSQFNNLFPLFEDILRNQLRSYPTVKILFSDDCPEILLKRFGINNNDLDINTKANQFLSSFDDIISKNLLLAYPYAHLSFSIVAFLWEKIIDLSDPMLHETCKNLLAATNQFFRFVSSMPENDESSFTFLKTRVLIFSLIQFIVKKRLEGFFYELYSLRSALLTEILGLSKISETVSLEGELYDLTISAMFGDIFAAIEIAWDDYFLAEGVSLLEKMETLLLQLQDDEKTDLSPYTFIDDFFNYITILMDPVEDESDLRHRWGNQYQYVLIGILTATGILYRLLERKFTEDKDIDSYSVLYVIYENVIIANASIFLETGRFSEIIIILTHFLINLCNTPIEKFLDEIYHVNISDRTQFEEQFKQGVILYSQLVKNIEIKEKCNSILKEL